jgi:hypothetical protein
MTVLLSVIFLASMQAAAPSSVHVVSRDMTSMVGEPKQAIARSAAEWSALWRQHAGDKALPEVDFNKHTVVAVFLGSRSSAGFAADVTGVRQVPGGVVVEWQERRPQPGQVSAQVLTSPAVIVTIPRVTGTVSFEKVER